MCARWVPGSARPRILAVTFYPDEFFILCTTVLGLAKSRSTPHLPRWPLSLIAKKWNTADTWKRELMVPLSPVTVRPTSVKGLPTLLLPLPEGGIRPGLNGPEGCGPLRTGAEDPARQRPQAGLWPQPGTPYKGQGWRLSFYSWGPQVDR